MKEIDVTELLELMPETNDTARQAKAGCIAIGDHFKKRMSQIDNDRRLSEEGKREERAKARQETEAALSAWSEKEDAPLEKAVRNTELEVSKAGTSVDAEDATDLLGYKKLTRELIKQARQASIIQSVAGLDPLEVQALYFGDATPEVREALETAPPRIVKTQTGPRFEPWIAPELVTRQRLGAATLANPDAVERLRVLQDLRKEVAGFGATLRHAVRRAVPLDEPTTVRG